MKLSATSTRLSGGARQGQALLDSLGVAALGAYSLRKLRAGYAGPAVRVRRSNDNAESDIGFTGAGALDSAALLSFTGANNAFVTTWYDQSGGARHAIRTTMAYQPRIVNAGTYLGAVTIDSGTSQGLWATDAALGLAAQPLTVACALKSAAVGSSALGLIWNLGRTSGSRLFAGVGVGTRDLIVRGSGGNRLASPTQTLLAGGNVMAWTKGAAANMSAVQSYLNGVGPSTYSAEAFSATDNTFGPNGSADPAVSAAHAYQELILFGTVFTAGQLAAMARNQGAYFGVTVA